MLSNDVLDAVGIAGYNTRGETARRNIITPRFVACAERRTNACAIIGTVFNLLQHAAGPDVLLQGQHFQFFKFHEYVRF